MTRPAEQVPAIARLLMERRDEIATAWAQLTQELPKPHDHERPLAEIRSWTMRGVGAMTEALMSGSDAPLQRHLADVSLRRLQSDFDSSEVIEGLLLCKEAALPYIWAAFAPGSREAYAAVVQLDACLRHMVALFGSLYAEALQRDLQQEEKRTALLLEAVRTASSSPDLEQVLERIAAGMAAAVGVQAGSIYLLDAERGTLVLRAPTGHQPPERVAAWRNILLNHPASESLVAELLEQRVPVVLSRDESDPRSARQAAAVLGLPSLLVVPIMVGDRLLGAAMMYTFDAHIFSAEQIELAQGIANAVALIIENALLYEKTQRQLAASQALQRVTAALLQQRGLAEILEIVVTEARSLTGALGCAILLLEDDGWLRVVRRTGPSTPAVDHISVEGTFTGEVLRRGELLLTNDPTNEIPLYDAVDRPAALLAVPLRANQSIIGTLNVLDKPGGFTRDDAQVIGLVADQAAIAIENARLHQQAEDFAVLEERQRIARDLHDSVTQALYSMSLSGEAAVRLLNSGDPVAAEGYVRKVRDTAQEALQEMRLLLLELHPPVLEQEGLVAALQARLEMLEGRAAVQTELHVEGEERLPLGVKETIYRIAQELLNNVLKHARARRVMARLHFAEKRVWLEVSDDGVGFDPATVAAKGGLGLRGMEERAALVAGTFSVESAPGRGTTVRLEVPIP